jgi:thiamine-phosphate diphosphorylase
VRGPRPWICLVTDRRRLAPESRTDRDAIVALERQVDAAVDAGVDVVHVRERDLSARRLAELTTRIVTRTRPTNTIVVVNDRADVAWVAGADGVHLPASGAPVPRIRGLHPSWRIGRAVHGEDELARASGADYVMAGTVFETASKPDAAAAGVEALADLVRRAPCPVLAIGGITPERARACVVAGAAGVAAIGLFLPPGRAPQALGPAAAVGAVRRAWAGLL